MTGVETSIKGGTIPLPEQVDIYDENFSRLGQLSREEAHLQGAWHKAVHCWIVSPKENGSILFQLRSPDTTFYPGTLDITAAGHVSAGEGKEAVLREIEEELNLKPSIDDLVDLGIKIDVGKFGSITNREFAHVFMWHREQALDQYRPNPLEVPGLYEIGIDTGLKLFTGQAERISVEGIVWDRSAKNWRQSRIEVSPQCFVPRIDLYYLRIFILGRRLIDGEDKGQLVV